jgi:carbon storage regulator
MLVLTREIGESVIIGDNIKIMVVGWRPGKVRLGISAPRDLPVWREEIAVTKKGYVDPQQINGS